MNLRKLIIIIWLLSTFSIKSTQFRNLIGILDPSIDETPLKDKAANLSTTINSLNQDNAILILTPSTWNNFITRKNRFKKLKNNKFNDKYLLLDKTYPGYKPEDIAKYYQEYYKSYKELTDFVNKNSKEPQKIFDNFKKSKKIDFIEKNEKNIYLDFKCYKTKLNPDDWICKKNDQLILFIPKNYYKKIKSQINQNLYDFLGTNIDTNNLNIKLNKNQKITLQELVLGIKFNSFKDYFNILEPFINNKVSQKINITDKNNPIKDIFITRDDLINKQDLASNKYELLLLDWFIFLTGHGSPLSDMNQKIENIEKIKNDPKLWGYICGIPAKVFYSLLKFFNSQINTKLLFYNSCYGSGVHTEILNSLGVPKDKQFEDIIQTTNYILISGALTDTTSSVLSPTHLMPPYSNISDIGNLEFKKNTNEKYDIKLEGKENFQDFFDKLEKYFSSTKKGKTEKLKLIDILSLVHSFKAESKNKNEYHALLSYNIPIMRFPNTEWFKVTQINNFILSLTDFDIATKIAKGIKEITLNSNKAVLLYSKSIPFTFNIEKAAITFLSMISGPAKHIIEGIKIKNITRLFYSFLSLNYAGYEKIFAIKKATIANNNYENIILAQELILPIFAKDNKPENYFYYEEKDANNKTIYNLYKIPTNYKFYFLISEKDKEEMLKNHINVTPEILNQIKSYFKEGLYKNIEQIEKAIGFKKISKFLVQKKKKMEVINIDILKNNLRNLNNNLLGLTR